MLSNSVKVRLWADGQLLVDQWVDQRILEWGNSIPLVAGRRYRVLMEYYENFMDATAVLSWSSASQPKMPVPGSQTYGPAQLLRATDNHVG